MINASFKNDAKLANFNWLNVATKTEAGKFFYKWTGMETNASKAEDSWYSWYTAITLDYENPKPFGGHIKWSIVFSSSFSCLSAPYSLSSEV